MQFSQDIFGLVPAGLHGTMAAHNVPFISDVPMSGCVGGHCGQVGQLGAADQDAGPLLAALVGAVGGYFFGRSRGQSPGKAAVPAAIGAAVGYFVLGKAIN